MPYLKGKLKGQLKPAEIRKIIRLHNELSKIKIPPRLDRDGLIKFVESKGFKIDHENEKIVNKNKMKETLTLKEAKEKFPVKPRKKKEVKKEEKKPEKKKEPLQLEDKKKKESIEKPKVDKDGIPILKKYDVIEYKTKGNKKIKAYVSSTFAKNTYRMNHIILKDDGSFSEDEKDTMDLPDMKLTKDRQFTFIGKLNNDRNKVIFLNPIEKKDKKPEKKKKDFKVERFERTKMINEAGIKNPFKILGIKAREETPELVKKKCRELRLKNHPDKGGDKDKFDLIQKACDILLSTQTKL